jgi:lipopolysaccharide export system permease protein
VLIFRYLMKETIKSQTAVFLVLMAIFLTKNFVDVLADATNGDIPASLILGFLALSMPVLAALILPLSLFLGILLAHGRLYVDSEMTVFHACGISEWYITRVMLVLACVMALLTGAITLWLAPLSVENEYQLE